MCSFFPFAWITAWLALEPLQQRIPSNLSVARWNVFIIYKLWISPLGTYVTGSFARSSPCTDQKCLPLHLQSYTARSREKLRQTKGTTLAVFQPFLFCFLSEKHESLYPSRDLSTKSRFLDSGFIVYMAAIFNPPALFCYFNVYSTNGPFILVSQSIM